MKVTVKEPVNQFEGIKAEYYKSLSEAPKEIQRKYKAEGVDCLKVDSSIFMWEDAQAKDHNAKYIK